MAGMKLRQRVLGRYPKWYRVFFVQCVEIRIDLVKVNIAVSSIVCQYGQLVDQGIHICFLKMLENLDVIMADPTL